MPRFLLILPFLFLAVFAENGVFGKEASQPLPKQDVVAVPAIGAGLCVSNAFQANMVLQRDKPLNIWGWAAPGEEIALSFGGQQARAKAAADRSWQVTLKPMPANKSPQTMTITGKSATLTLENILLGDVWILGGQSNMEFPIGRVDDGHLEVVSANFPQIRLLQMPTGKGFESVRSFERLDEWSGWSKRHFRKGDWNVCSPETVEEFSAIGYIFGRRLFMASQVPIGLINTSIGGTTVETWTPDEVLRKIDGRETRDLLKEWGDKIAAFDAKADLERRIANYDKDIEKKKARGESAPTDLKPGPAADRNRPGSCFAGVIRPLAGLAVKGVIFHQGYNNCFNGSAGARMYYQVFGKMVTAWRENFGDAHLPFCIISLCTSEEPQTRENFVRRMFDAGPGIREAQYKTFLDFRNAGDKNVGFVSSFDQRKKFYHPQIKIPVGERAAKWALATEYKAFKGADADEYWLPPMVKEVAAVGSTIKLTLTTEVRMRDESEEKLLGFAIAGEDRRFFPADAEYFSDGSKTDRNRPVESRNILLLSSPFVPKPVHFRYAWARNPMGNVTNSRQVPLAAQRSDDWLMEEMPLIFPAGQATANPAAAKSIRASIVKELELDDTDRRIKEAEATIAKLKDQYARDRAAWDAKKGADQAKLKAEDGSNPPGQTSTNKRVK